jgi:hypothetical protein
MIVPKISKVVLFGLLAFQASKSDHSNLQNQQLPSEDTIIRYRDLFFPSNFLCTNAGTKGGIAALLGVRLTLLTFGLFKPGNAGDSGKGKGNRKLARSRQITQTPPDLRMLQDPKYLENLSESEPKHLVHKTFLKELEWNEKENPDLPGCR